MSLLTICQQVLSETGFPNQTQIVGNSDETARRLLGFSKRAGLFLSKYSDWSFLNKIYTFPTVASTATYNFPSDFDRFISNTQWDRTNHWALEGPLTPQEWEYVKSGLVQNSPRARFRVLPASQINQFNIDPTPSSVVTIAFEYVSNQWCQSAAAVAQSQWAADTDVAIGNFEYLITLDAKWRFMHSIGMDYADEKDEFENQLDMAKARDGGNRIIKMAQRFPLLANTSETGFGQ